MPHATRGGLALPGFIPVVVENKTQRIQQIGLRLLYRLPFRKHFPKLFKRAGEASLGGWLIHGRQI